MQLICSNDMSTLGEKTDRFIITAYYLLMHRS